MAEFTGSPMVSPFPSQNILFNSAAGITGQQIQQNQLGIQQKQMELTDADHEQVARLSAALLGVTDPDQRAQLYARGVGVLQSQGLAKYAPPTVPDEPTLRMLAQQGMPSGDIYKLQLGQQAGQGLIKALMPTDGTASTAAPGTTTGTTAAPSMAIPARGTGGPGASASAPTEWLPYFEEASKETGIPVDLLLAQARQESSFNPNNVGTSGEIGLFQIMPSTARSPGPGMQGVDPATLTGADNVRNNILFGARYLKSKMGGGDPNNPAVQAAALHAYNGLGVGGDPNYVQNVFRYRPTLAPSDPNAAVTAYTPPTAVATTATAAPAGGGGPSGSYQVASTAPVPPPPPTAPPGGPPVAAPQYQAPANQLAPPTAATAPAGATPAQPAPVAAATPPAAPGTTATPAQPAPAPGTPAAILAPPTAPPAVPQMTTPHGVAVPAPPSAPALLSNGLTPQQWAVVQAEALRPGADLGQIAGQVMQLATSNRAALQQAWQDTHPDLTFKETSTGAIALNPKTGQIVGSYTYQPNMQSRAVEGSATWDGSQWVPAVPGQPSVPGKWVYSGSNRGDFQPAASQPATASFDLQKELYKRDTDQLPDYNTQNQQAAANQIRIQQMRELVDQVASGAGGAERANWANIADTLGWHDLAKQLTGMGGAAAAQEFAKYGLATAGAQERGDLGARGSLGAISLYKSANPGLELQPDANKKMLTAQLIAAQANRDYTQQAMDYVNSNAGQFLHGGTYTPLSHFDAEWAAARNPQIYAAAMGAINGDPWDKWTKALNMKNPDDVQRVIGIVRRADPTSAVMWNNGQPHAVGTGQ